ncbi:MAG: hypothetical protein ACE5G0_04950 [Rhodothermales bacterium]
MKRTIHVRQRFIAYGFVCAVALLTATPTVAQISEVSPATYDAALAERISNQLIASLDSPIAQIRQKALQHINFFATHHRDEIDLTGATPKLIEIYESDKQEGFRILALASLRAIGHESIIRYLGENARMQQSARVRELTFAALADYARARTL